MNNSGTSKISSYSDLLAIIKETFQLRVKMMTKPSEKDVSNYKILTKAYEAYNRIKNHPDITIDTINSVVTKNDNKIENQNKTQTQTQNQIQNKSSSSLIKQQSNENTNSVIYLFGNQNSDSSDIDSEMDPNELFIEDKPPEKLPDDNDVELMLKKSSFQLNRALNNRNYIVIEESEESEEDSKSSENPEPSNQKPSDITSDLPKSEDQEKNKYTRIDYDEEDDLHQINIDDETNEVDKYKLYDDELYGITKYYIKNDLTSFFKNNYFKNNYKGEISDDETDGENDFY